MRKLRMRTSTHSLVGDLTPLARLWVLRMLVLLGGQRQFIEPRAFMGDSLAEAIGLSEMMTDTDRSFSPQAARAALRRLYQAAERQRPGKGLPRLLRANVERLGAIVGLDPTARHILAFVVLLKSDCLVSEAADTLGALSTLKAIRALSVILGLPEGAVRAALAPEAPLGRSGLLQVERGGSCDLGDKFNLLCDDFADTMVSGDGDPMHLLKGAVRPATPGTLEASDYAHVAPAHAMLAAYLAVARDTGRKGVNVLFHGVPGTGKSELARLMAREVGCELLEIVSEDEDGDPIDGEQRLRAYRAAQCIFARRPTLILFDEIEDVFDDEMPAFRQRSSGRAHKSWVNRMLETNPVPAFWLTNSVTCLDPAIVRRFDMVIQLPVPPRRQRKAIIEKACAGLLDGAATERLAAAQMIAPAVVARAASVTRAIAHRLEGESPSAVVERLVAGTLKAQGCETVGRLKDDRLGEAYDPAFINADVDLAAVARALVKTPSARICLYGPPGTGKTAFAHWLACQLDRPLLTKRGSDLLSMWVGGTEQALAEAFREADEDDAVLLIDEVDSFLRDRRGAQYTWEVTQVNELLTQMEAFDRILIVSTNLMDALDQAALRRFDIKARFDFLTRDQAWALLCRHCASQATAEPGDDHRCRLAALDRLTPGDFAAAARRLRLSGSSDASAWIEALEAERACKEGATARIGFVWGR